VGGPPDGWGWSDRPDGPADEPAPPWGWTVPLEPPDPPPSAEAPPERLTTAPDAPSTRRFTIVACTVLLVAALVASVAAVVSWRNGERWRDLAVARGERAGELAALLEVSEDDVADLEARIRQLANEKAQAEDQREAAEGTTGVADEAAAVAAAADECATAVEELRLAARDPAVGDGTLRALADRAVTACVAARRAGADLADELGGLPD
jgi:hypothetical protein